MTKVKYVNTFSLLIFCNSAMSAAVSSSESESESEFASESSIGSSASRLAAEAEVVIEAGASEPNFLTLLDPLLPPVLQGEKYNNVNLTEITTNFHKFRKFPKLTKNIH